MAKKKSNYLILAGFILLGGLLFGGCGTFNWFNPDFLNQYQPLGMTSLSTLQAKGPVTLVLENLTEEAKHQENALFTVYYIDAQGNTQTLTPRTPLNAVPTSLANPDDPTHPFNPRNPSDPHYDSSYRQVFILDCGVREVWFSAAVFRTKILTLKNNLITSSSTTTEITICSAQVTRTPSDLSVPATSMTTNTFEQFTAYQAPPFHLKETSHFQCGDVIVAGILDLRDANQKITPMVLECDYTDLGSLSRTFPAGSTIPAFGGIIYNPSHAYLLEEYNYPAGYVIIPLALPNMSGIETVLPTMKSIAAEWAGKDLAALNSATTTKTTKK